MIPKILHYCWLSGDPYPPLVQRCISSWSEKLPGYELMLWDRSRIDITGACWLKEAYENRKYAFAADYIRFYALYHYGGIYLDSDVEVLKSFDPMLDKDYIIGEEAGGDIEAAVIGSVKNAVWVKECLDYYTNRHFVIGKDKFDMRPVPLLVGKVVKQHNLAVYPYTFYSPKNYILETIDIAEETFCIHHFDGKWLERGFLYNIKKSVHGVLYRLLGRKGHNKTVRFLRNTTDYFRCHFPY